MVPTAVRMKPSTIRIRLKPVTVNRIAGTSVSPPISSRIWTALLEVTGSAGTHVQRRTVHSRTRSSSPDEGEGIRIGSGREAHPPATGLGSDIPR